MKIYTRRGDGGETDLLGGPRVAKDHLRVEAYGAVDELNASLGVCAATTRQADLRGILQRVQELLFTLGSYLAMAATQSPQDDAVLQAPGGGRGRPGAEDRSARTGACPAAALHPARRLRGCRRSFTWRAPRAGAPSASLFGCTATSPSARCRCAT